MSACLSFGEIIESGKPQLIQLDAVGSSLSPNDPSACVAFSKQVRLLEGILTHSYSLAVSIVRRAENLSEIAETWKQMESLCSNSLQTLKKWKDKYPYCGTSELFDLALDYKLACSKRYASAVEEMECQKQDLPKGLFPETT
jgi:hypothetical protein